MRRSASALLAAAWLLAAPALACAGEEGQIAADALLARIEAGSAPTVVDVRSRREFESGHVPGAIHIPFWAASGRADQISAAKDAPVVVYCEHGPRATLARVGLQAAGFENVITLAGHMSGWKEAGLPQAQADPEARPEGEDEDEADAGSESASATEPDAEAAP